MADIYVQVPQSEVTLETLATVKSLALDVMRQIVGNELSSQLNGETLTTDVYNHLISARQRANIQVLSQGATQ